MLEYAHVGAEIGSLVGPPGRIVGAAVATVVAVKSKECKPCEEKKERDSRKDGDPHRA